MTTNPMLSLYHPNDHPVEARLVSKETTPKPEEKSIIEVTPYDKTLKLAFIRSTKEFPFKTTMKQFLCYAKENGFERVFLEDDALFPDKNDPSCEYRALFYRLFEGKNSLYVNQGFQTTTDVTAEKLRLQSATVEQVKEIASMLPDDAPHKLHTTLLNAPDKDNFGTWLLKQECFLMREFMVKIEAAAAKVTANTKIGNDGKQFLKDWRRYFNAHQDLQRIPTCESGGGRLRSRTQTSSGRKHKRRVTRKNRRDRKGSRKA